MKKKAEQASSQKGLEQVSCKYTWESWYECLKIALMWINEKNINAKTLAEYEYIQLWINKYSSNMINVFSVRTILMTKLPESCKKKTEFKTKAVSWATHLTFFSLI